eukprot:PLAT10060.1.p1 GENE.PLAT10060.1~~PLAT10060.1.p1  ORF type:complete len:826 (+),score=348.43 PLAT10060.1:232-2478(+)
MTVLVVHTCSAGDTSQTYCWARWASQYTMSVVGRQVVKSWVLFWLVTVLQAVTQTVLLFTVDGERLRIGSAVTWLSGHFLLVCYRLVQLYHVDLTLSLRRRRAKLSWDYALAMDPRRLLFWCHLALLVQGGLLCTRVWLGSASGPWLAWASPLLLALLAGAAALSRVSYLHLFDKLPLIGLLLLPAAVSSVLVLLKLDALLPDLTWLGAVAPLASALSLAVLYYLLLNSWLGYGAWLAAMGRGKEYCRQMEANEVRKRASAWSDIVRSEQVALGTARLPVWEHVASYYGREELADVQLLLLDEEDNVVETMMLHALPLADVFLDAPKPATKWRLAAPAHAIEALIRFAYCRRYLSCGDADQDADVLQLARVICCPAALALLEESMALVERALAKDAAAATAGPWTLSGGETRPVAEGSTRRTAVPWWEDWMLQMNRKLLPAGSSGEALRALQDSCALPRLPTDFTHLLASGAAADLALRPSDGELLRVHRMLLCQLPYFAGLLGSGMVEAQRVEEHLARTRSDSEGSEEAKGDALDEAAVVVEVEQDDDDAEDDLPVIDLPDADRQALTLLLTIIYSGHMDSLPDDVSASQLLEVALLSQLWALVDLLPMLVPLFAKQLQPAEAPDLFLHAQALSLPRLEAVCAAMISQRYNDVAREADGFSRLPAAMRRQAFAKAAAFRPFRRPRPAGMNPLYCAGLRGLPRNTRGVLSEGMPVCLPCTALFSCCYLLCCKRLRCLCAGRRCGRHCL